MRWTGRTFALLALGLAFAGASRAVFAQSTHTCVDPGIVEALPAPQKRMVEEMAAAYRDSTCRNDECEFRVEALANGETLVKMRARRFVPQTGACGTVYMSEMAAVFDVSGKVIDLWPYCLLMAHEATRPEPAFRPDPIPYKVCQAGAP